MKSVAITIWQTPRKMVDHDSEVQQEKYDIYRHHILAVSEEDIGFELEGPIHEGDLEVQRERDDTDSHHILKGSPEEDVGIEIKAQRESYEMVAITRINGMASTFSGLDKMMISA
ncbi:uncharacterized protein ARMOST_22320 [Armillaria ostoyae]|uniref:Uncharacterized protein n=1 Tax=Armillaria ostoyae TaxID=47428 RepID=A0A284SCJ1_ARMOS|nr:uncharacterized protein ARMOST_22320 [Armillaria ostoyae]